MFLAFLQELLERPRAVGAVCSSSRRLAECMTRHLDLSRGGPVLELGAGTGAITEELLRGGVRADQLVVLEQSDRFVRHLRHRFPGVHVVCGDACEADRLLHRLGPFDAVVSGLPLRSLHDTAVSRITEACCRLLAADGKLLQFTYALTMQSPWLREEVQRVASQRVLLNFPPARVDVFRRIVRASPEPPG